MTQSIIFRIFHIFAITSFFQHSHATFEAHSVV